MGEILVGTCSWTDPTLIRSGASIRPRPNRQRPGSSSTPASSGWLRWTAPTTPCPAKRPPGSGCERTGPDFIFDIKAFRLFTMHPTPLVVLPKDIREALPKDLQDKKNIYQKDLPPKLVNELWSRFEQGPPAPGQRRQAGSRPLPVPALVLPRRRAAGLHPLLQGEAAASTGSPSSSATTPG